MQTSESCLANEHQPLFFDASHRARSADDVEAGNLQLWALETPTSLGSDHEGGGAGDACVGGDRRGSLTEGRNRLVNYDERRGSAPRLSNRNEEVSVRIFPPKHARDSGRYLTASGGSIGAGSDSSASSSRPALSKRRIRKIVKEPVEEGTQGGSSTSDNREGGSGNLADVKSSLGRNSENNSEHSLGVRGDVRDQYGNGGVVPIYDKPIPGTSRSVILDNFRGPVHSVPDLGRTTPTTTNSIQRTTKNGYSKSLEHDVHNLAGKRWEFLRENSLPSANVKVQDLVKNGIEIFPPGADSRSATPRHTRDHSPIWVTRTSRPGAVADPEEAADDEWAERVSLSDTSEYPYPEPGRHSPKAGSDPARTGKRKPTKANARSRRLMSRPGRRGCCRIIHLKEDNARFILLAVVMVFYMLSGAAIFNALERDNELVEMQNYKKYVQEFKDKYREVNETDLLELLNIHSQAELAGFTGNKRPRWDFSGAFYFVGTVVSTIGESRGSSSYFRYIRVDTPLSSVPGTGLNFEL